MNSAVSVESIIFDQSSSVISLSLSDVSSFKKDRNVSASKGGVSIDGKMLIGTSVDGGVGAGGGMSTGEGASWEDSELLSLLKLGVFAESELVDDTKELERLEYCCDVSSLSDSWACMNCDGPDN